MSLFKYFLLLGFLIGFSVACSNAPSKYSVSGESSSGKLVNQGLKQLSEQQNAKALESFETVLKNDTTSPYVPVALYNSGVALQGLKRWPESIEKFKSVLQYYSGSVSLQQAETFYRLALSYEAVGDDPKCLAALLDANSRAKVFPEDLQVEILARIAGTYARLGNATAAEKAYDKAEAAMQKLKRQTPKGPVPPWLPRTLYNMGKMTLKKMTLDDFETGLKPLGRAQVWLLRSAEVGDPVWSSLASFEIIQIYRDAWSLVQSVPVKDGEDKLIALKEQQEKMMSHSQTLYHLVNQLRLERIPDSSSENKYVKEIFDYLAGLEVELEKALQSRPVEQGLTPEGQKMEDLRQNVKLINPPEQKSGTSSTQEKQPSTSGSPKKDPNL